MSYSDGRTTKARTPTSIGHLSDPLRIGGRIKVRRRHVEAPEQISSPELTFGPKADTWVLCEENNN